MRAGHGFCLDETPRVNGATLYDLLIERWNARRPSGRRAFAAECRQHGHDWAPLSLGGAVCRRCLRYTDPDG